jgi:peptidoglycan/LPS O-acetylase OafA/YrhL
LGCSRNSNWRIFIIRRFFRIYPPYLFAVLLFALFVPSSRIHWSISGIAQLVSHLALVHNYFNEYFFGINGSFWSVAVEAQLYLLYPVLLWFVKRLGWHYSLVFIATLEISLRTIASAILVVSGKPPDISFSGLPFLYWYSWSIGAAVAEAHLLGRTVPFANQSLIAWSVAAICSSFLKPFASFSFLCVVDRYCNR